jgi:predicted chitinase
VVDIGDHSHPFGRFMGVHMSYDHEIFFDYVRDSLFGGSMGQLQVEGMEAILNAWERYLAGEDQRWLAYMLATTYHETAQEMQPIEEYGKGAGMPYGEVDPETGQIYYGRGFIMTTWRDNYRRTDNELGLEGDDRTEWNADLMLDPTTSARGMWFGMSQGWYRSDEDGPQTLERYFSAEKDDPYGAREIINGDKHYVPSWSGGVSIGNLIKGYHKDFLFALEQADADPAAA